MWPASIRPEETDRVCVEELDELAEPTVPQVLAPRGPTHNVATPLSWYLLVNRTMTQTINHNLKLPTETVAEVRNFTIGNRRYLGAKTKLLPSIERVIVDRLGRIPTSFFDAFAGSGVVGALFASLGSRVIMNDLLAHNALAHQTFLLHKQYSEASLLDHLHMMSNLPPVSGYITETFGGKYFSENNARKLDAWREYIESYDFDNAMEAALVTCVLYAADKVAQTVGHYDAYFASNQIDRGVDLRFPAPIGTGEGHLVLNKDANLVIQEHEVEVLYLDPPYNSRQYSDNYHVVENIARWEKPEVRGVSRKMDRTGMKSRFSGRQAAEAFKELIIGAKAKLIVLSYSNTGTSRVSRSNNVLSDEYIVTVLKDKGRVDIQEIDFKEFSVGRTSHRTHRERLFICEVGTP